LKYTACFDTIVSLVLCCDIVEHGWNVVQPEKPCRSRHDSPSPSVDSKKNVDVVSISSTASDPVTSCLRAGGLRTTAPSCALCKSIFCVYLQSMEHYCQDAN